MAEFSISMWFAVEAEDYADAYAIQRNIGNVVINSVELDVTDFGEIDVEMTEEDCEGDDE